MTIGTSTALRTLEVVLSGFGLINGGVDILSILQFKELARSHLSLSKYPTRT